MNARLGVLRARHIERELPGAPSWYVDRKRGHVGRNAAGRGVSRPARRAAASGSSAIEAPSRVKSKRGFGGSREAAVEVCRASGSVGTAGPPAGRRLVGEKLVAGFWAEADVMVGYGHVV